MRPSIGKVEYQATSALVLVTVRTAAMAYRRWLMHREAAGIATEIAMMTRLAIVRMSNALDTSAKALTDITPHGGPINGIVAPNDGIDEQGEQACGSPEHVEAGSCIPCWRIG